MNIQRIKEDSFKKKYFFAFLHSTSGFFQFKQLPALPSQFWNWSPIISAVAFHFNFNQFYVISIIFADFKCSFDMRERFIAKLMRIWLFLWLSVLEHFFHSEVIFQISILLWFCVYFSVWFSSGTRQFSSFTCRCAGGRWNTKRDEFDKKWLLCGKLIKQRSEHRHKVCISVQIRCF